MNTSTSAAKTKSNAERKAIRAERLQLLRRNKAFLVGAFILGFWLLIAVFGSMIAPHPYDAMDFMAVSKRPSGTYFFGTNKLGQDVFSRVLAGTQLIVWMSFLATALGTVVGGTLGLAAGYFKGWFDIVLMRLLEAISAIPVLIVALLAIAALDGQSSGITVGVIGFVFAPNIARTVRAAVLSEAELEYVAAARLRAERVWQSPRGVQCRTHLLVNSLSGAKVSHNTLYVNAEIPHFFMR
jgi:peptide/nickel transport system permease protein